MASYDPFMHLYLKIKGAHKRVGGHIYGQTIGVCIIYGQTKPSLRYHNTFIIYLFSQLAISELYYSSGAFWCAGFLAGQ